MLLVDLLTVKCMLSERAVIYSNENLVVCCHLGPL